jgi:hypothetical protein
MDNYFAAITRAQYAFVTHGQPGQPGVSAACTPAASTPRISHAARTAGWHHVNLEDDAWWIAEFDKRGRVGGRAGVDGDGRAARRGALSSSCVCAGFDFRPDLTEASKQFCRVHGDEWAKHVDFNRGVVRNRPPHCPSLRPVARNLSCACRAQSHYKNNGMVFFNRLWKNYTLP